MKPGEWVLAKTGLDATTAACGVTPQAQKTTGRQRCSVGCRRSSRLAFTTLADAEYLPAPFLEANRAIVELLLQGRMQDAADALDDYFTRTERTVLAALGRRRIR